MCGNNWWKCYQSGSLTMSPTPIEDATSHNRLSVIKFMELVSGFWCTEESPIFHKPPSNDRETCQSPHFLISEGLKFLNKVLFK